MATTAPIRRIPGQPSRQPARPRPAAASNIMVLLPAVILFYTVILPPEVRLSLGEQVLFAPRIIGFALLPWILWQLVRGQVRFVIWDYLFFFGSFWMVFAFMVYYGPADGVIRGGALAFDYTIPYLIGRICFKNTTDVRRFLIMVAPGLILAGLSMLMEVLASRPLVRPAFASIFGDLSAFQDGKAIGARESFIDRRLGILRANGPFAHPILAGVLLASFLPLYFFSGIRKWPFFVGVGASLFAVLSASSAAFLGLMIGAGTLMVDWGQRLVAFISWRLIIPVVGAAMLTLHFLSENGIFAVLGRFTLNPQTAFYRRLIWEYGTRSVYEHPWIGIGFTSYERLDWMIASVDNHWLLLAIRFGFIPAVLSVIVVVAGITLLALSTRGVDEVERKMRVGIATALFSVFILGFTVAFFGGVQTWFYMLIAIAISIGAGGAQRTKIVMRRPGPVNRGRALPLNRIT